MATWKTPGVYVEDIPKPAPAVAEVPTAIAAFVGYTEKADQQAPGDLLGRALRVTSLASFEASFGKAAPLTIQDVVLDAAGHFVSAKVAAPYLLHHSLRLFYANGGAVAYVVSVGGFRSDGQVRCDDLLAGLKAVADLDEITLLLCPDAALLSAPELGTVQQAMLQQSARLQNRMALLDTRRDDPLGGAFRDHVGTLGLSYGAAYTPWLQVHHGCPVPYAALRNTPIACPPSGAVAGVFAAVDAQRGVWKAPANVAVSGVVAPVATLSADNAAALLQVASGKCINTLRFFPGKGLLVWGARTLAGNDNEWRHVPMRRLAMMVQTSLQHATAWVAFEPNNPATWARLRGMVENYLTLKWRDGALMGSKPEEAFFVRCGLHETMTEQDVQAGRVIVQLALAMVRPAEFTVLRFSCQTQGG